MPYDSSRVRLAVEFVILFVVLPAIIWAARGRVHFLLPLLIFAISAGVWLARARGRRILWNESTDGSEKRQLTRVLIRFVPLAILLTLATARFAPDLFLSLPRNRTLLWSLIMLLYPLLSVYPQELIYRAFFFERYRPILRNELLLISASAVSFGLMHVIFYNGIAVVLTLVGGWLFADTWSRTRSLRLVSLEHALWGDLIFTIGLGRYFYLGNVS